MVGWHHWLNGHEFEQAPGECRTRKSGVLQSMRFQSQTTEQLNNSQDTEESRHKGPSYYFYAIIFFKIFSWAQIVHWQCASCWGYDEWSQVIPALWSLQSRLLQPLLCAQVGLAGVDIRDWALLQASACRGLFGALLCKLLHHLK